MISETITLRVDKCKLKCCRCFVCLIYIFDIIKSISMIFLHLVLCKVSFTTTSQCSTVEPKWLREKNSTQCFKYCRLGGLVP